MDLNGRTDFKMDNINIGFNIELQKKDTDYLIINKELKE